MPSGQRKSVYRVSAASDMNSNELERYREQIHYEEAVCRQENFGQEWRCPCGLVHTREENRCVDCETAISQDGNFI